jgi:hypothetical protein
MQHDTLLVFNRLDGRTDNSRRRRVPRGPYTVKQDRKAGYIEKSYEKRGVSKKEAESRAWATADKQDRVARMRATAVR